RALNNIAGISPDTRRQILAMTEELCYHPNAIARSLQGQPRNILAYGADVGDRVSTELFFFFLLARRLLRTTKCDLKNEDANYADITTHIAIWSPHATGGRPRQRGGTVLPGWPEDVLRRHDHGRPPADRRRAPGRRDGRLVGPPAQGGRRHDAADQRAGRNAADGARSRADRAAVACRMALPARPHGDPAPGQRRVRS